MVKRIVDTGFWTDMQVIDHYSIEDKYFFLYLMTNDKSTQVGIYSLPKKVMSFETGFTTDVIQVLLDRFSTSYKRIIYSEKTQEITVLQSLQTSILKGGKPVSDLLQRELSKIKDSKLILATYEEMKPYWELSKRTFDQTIKELFEHELANRSLFVRQNQNENQKQKQNEKQNDNENKSHNENHNHNQESWATNRRTNRDVNVNDPDEEEMLEHYAEFLKQSKPDYEGDIHSENIVTIFYEEMIGDVHPHINNQLNQWLKTFPKSLVLEALHRSVSANSPMLYAASIINNWKKEEVKTYKDVMRLDKNHNRNS